MFSPSRSGGNSCESFVTWALFDDTFCPSASIDDDSFAHELELIRVVLPRLLRLRVEPRAGRLLLLDERVDGEAQLLHLLLQDPQVGEHLLLFAALRARAGRRDEHHREKKHERSGAGHHSVLAALHDSQEYRGYCLAVTMNCARRLFFHDASTWPGSNGNSLP